MKKYLAIKIILFVAVTALAGNSDTYPTATNVEPLNFMGLRQNADGSTTVVKIPSASVVSASNFNASALSIGTLADARLSGHVTTNNYNLKDFGAYGDAKFANGLLATTNSTTVTVTYGSFTGADIGANIGIFGGGLNRRTFWTTIANVLSSTQIVLTAHVAENYNYPDADTNIAAFNNGFYAIYGQHDDTLAIQSWVNQVTNGGGTFFAPAGNYLILGAPQNTNQNDAQIIVPSPYLYGNGKSVANTVPIFNMRGPFASAPGFMATAGFYQADKNRATFVSNLQGGAPTSTNLWGAKVFDFAPYAGGQDGYQQPCVSSGILVPDSPIKPVIESLDLLMGYDANAIGFNCFSTFECEFHNVNLMGGCFLPVLCPRPTGTNGFGVISSGYYNGSAGEYKNVSILGFYNGLDMGLIRGDYLTFVDCVHALSGEFGGGAAKQKISNLQFTSCPIWFWASGDGMHGNAACTLVPELDVMVYQTIVTPGTVPDWQTNCISVYDPSNTLGNAAANEQAGYIHYNTTSQDVGTVKTYQNGPGANRQNFFAVTTTGKVITDGRDRVFAGLATFTGGGTYYLTPDNVDYTQAAHGYNVPVRVADLANGLATVLGNQSDVIRFNASPGTANGWTFNPAQFANGHSNYITSYTFASTNSCTLTGNLICQLGGTNAASKPGQLNLQNISFAMPAGTNVVTFTYTNTAANFPAGNWTSLHLDLYNGAATGATTNAWLVGGSMTFF